MPIAHHNLEVGELVGQVRRREIRLPEIQRAYVWSPSQIAKLVDSLYRDYPSGSILMWETEGVPVERDLEAGGDEAPHGKVRYLLDGQQRLTSLTKFMDGAQDARVVFNLVDEKFQIESAATKKDPRFVVVREVIELPGTFEKVTEISARLTGLTPGEISQRLDGLRQIPRRRYNVQVLSDFDYGEVTEVFVRVNSGGRALTITDLLTSTLSARWPGSSTLLSKKTADLAHVGFGDMDTGFLVRCLAGVVLHQGLSRWSYAAITRATDDELSEGWSRVERGIDHLVPLLKDVGVPHTKVLPSLNVLIPLIVFLGTRPDAPLSREDRDALVYWLLVATVSGRYSTAADTQLSNDIPAVLREDGVRRLVEGLGTLGARFAVSPEALIGKNDRSAYFFLSYLVARRRGAKDWWYGTSIDVAAQGTHAIQYHHVHPKATLAGRYTKAQINDLANLAFISAKANLKISARSPTDYFRELTAENLDEHLIPADEALRTADAYPDFLQARRTLLATAMTKLIEAFRPAWLSAPAEKPVAEIVTPTCDLTVYASDWERPKLSVTAMREGSLFVRTTIWLDELEAALEQADHGVTAEVEVLAGRVALVRDDADDLLLAVGPLVLAGSFAEWRRQLERERSEALPVSSYAPVGDVAAEAEPVLLRVTEAT